LRGPFGEHVPDRLAVGLADAVCAGAQRLPCPQPAEQPVHLGHGQADDVRIRAGDVFDEAGCEALDGVGAGLAARLAGRHVPGYLFRTDLQETNPGSLHVGEQFGAAPERYPGQHFVVAARQHFQHPDRIRIVPGLPQDGATCDDGRVGGKNQRAGIPADECANLVHGHTLDIRVRGLAGPGVLVDANRLDSERNAGRPQEFGATRGS